MVVSAHQKNDLRVWVISTKHPVGWFISPSEDFLSYLQGWGIEATIECSQQNLPYLLIRDTDEKTETLLALIGSALHEDGFSLELEWI